MNHTHARFGRNGPNYYVGILFCLMMASLFSCGDTTKSSDEPMPAVSYRHLTLNHLYAISGSKTMAGQHNREPNRKPARWTNYIKQVTGKYPALWSGDFLFQESNIDDRQIMVEEARHQWDNGAMINLMLHTCPPQAGEPCGWDPGVINSPLSNEAWLELTTDGTTLNLTWKDRLDSVAIYLRYLADHGVEVLFRPLHEMNQAAFWWGGRPGPDGTARLYRITHDYLQDHHGLTNLIWVWDMQDLSRDMEEYNPGDEYWDVFAFDVYSDGYDQSWYDYILTFVGDKPIAIGECGALPSSEMLARQPRWTFFMPWAEWVKNENTEQEIRNIYKDPRIITREEMPTWQ